MKKNIIVLGPLSSGHIQRWLSPFYDEYDFKFITLHPAKNDECLNVITLKKYTNTRLDFLLNIPYLIYLIWMIKPDLMHIHFLSSYGIMSAFIPQKKVKKILSIWGTDVNGKPTYNWFFKMMVSYSLKKFDAINCPAEHIKKKLISLFKHKKENIHVFQYGIELNNLPMKDNESPKSGAVKFVSIRNWDSLYHIDDLINGFALTNDADMELYIYGSGSELAKDKILKTINAVNDNRITLMGYTKREELLKQLSTMDVLVSIPDKDGAPLSVMEGMYIGLLPLLSDIDANHELISETDGVFITGYDLKDIADAFVYAKNVFYSENINDIVNRNRSRINIIGDYRINTNKMLELYECVMSDKRI